MGLPVITYNGKTVTLSSLPRSVFVSPTVNRTVNTTITGRSETIRLPRVDSRVRIEWPIMDSATMLQALENWWQWATAGEDWSLALDSARTIDTRLAVESVTGSTQFYLDDAAGIQVAGQYKLIDGPNYQVVTVTNVTGDRVTISETLDHSFGVGGIFRDRFYYLATIRDVSAQIPIQYLEAEKLPGWPPTRFLFTPEFYEDFGQEDDVIFKALVAAENGQNVNTAQPWFPTNSGVSVASDTTYFFDGYLRMSRSAGTTAHDTSLLFGGTATLTAISYVAYCKTGDTVASATTNATLVEVSTASVVKGSSSLDTEQFGCYVTGIVRVNAAGTIIPQFKYSAAPGGAPSIAIDTYFRLWPEGSGSVASRGTWA